MKNFLKKTDLPMRLLAIVLAVLLWGIVMMSTNPMRNYIIKTVPGSIELEGENTLLENYNLSVIDGQDSIISFSAEGTSSAISALLKNVSQIRVIVDVSDINTAGEHKLHYSIKLPDTSGISISENYRSKTIDLVIDQIISRDISVSLPENVGTPASGYIYETPKLDAQTVTVTGPAGVLNTVVTAQLNLKADGLNSSQSINCDYTLLNENGETVDSPYLTRETETVSVTMPVYKYTTVPLEVELRPSPDITEDMVKIKIEPTTIEVYGASALVDKITSISLGEIDLSRVQTGARISMGIRLPPGVKLMNGQPGTAAVTLQIDGVSSKTVKISDVQLIDTSAAQPKRRTKLVDEAIELTLSGKNSALTALDPTSIKVTVTFDSSLYNIGTYNIPVKVELPPDSGITVIGENTLQAKISIAEPDTTGENSSDQGVKSDGTAGEATQ